jgi:hypothetical protein
LTLNLLVAIAKQGKSDLRQLTHSPLHQQLSSITPCLITLQEVILLRGYLPLHKEPGVDEARKFQQLAADFNVLRAFNSLDS